MKSEHRLDIEEIERMKICRDNLQLMKRHIDTLEKYVEKVDKILKTEDVLNYKVKEITRLTDIMMKYI
jgi:hypothetical protein